MPMKPAAPESVAPIAKPKAASQPSGAGAMPMRMKSTAATIATVVYWRRKNAIAPSWIAPAIVCMRAFPGDCFITSVMRNAP